MRDRVDGFDRPRQPGGRAPRVAFLASYPPRECGIATFTRDLAAATASAGLEPPAIVAVDEPGADRAHGPEVRWRVPQDGGAGYRRLARELNGSDIDVLCVQHEFGLFGGEAGADLLQLLRGLDVPAITTLHTVFSDPPPAHRAVTRELARHSEALVVLARSAIPMLRDAYGIDPAKIRFVPHGIPSVHRRRGLRRETKAALGFADRTLLSTFGLIGPGKGIEDVIRALPPVVERHPELLYLVLGQTHPTILRDSGESYREGLQDLVAELGLQDHVRFEPRYLSLPELVNYLLATDVYLMAYLDAQQIVSGTLAYAVGCGKAVIATPFRYAQELLADGGGVLVPFRSPTSIARELAALLDDRVALKAMERRAYAASREMQWSCVGQAYRGLFAQVTAVPDDLQVIRSAPVPA